MTSPVEQPARDAGTRDGLVEPNPPAPPAPLPLWRRALAIVAAVALVAWVLTRIDFEKFRSAIGRADHAGFVAATLVFTLALLATDSLATAWVYRRTLCPVRFGEIFVLRGASYLPSLLNHHVGQAWLTWFAARVYRAPLARTLGATLVVYATVLGALVCIASASLPLARRVSMPWLTPLVAASVAAGAVYLVVLVAARASLRRRQATAVLAELGPLGHLAALAWRLPHVLVLFAGTWMPFWFFGVPIPLADALALVPALMLIAALPLTPQSVGTRDALAIELFSQYATGTADERAATIAAATLSWAVTLTLIQAVLSPLLMRRAQHMLRA
jgi:hypothetical protein